MNAEFETKLHEEALKFLETMKHAVVTANDFAKAQIPDVIEQWLRMRLIEATLFSVVAFCVFLFGLWVIRKGFRLNRESQIDMTLMDLDIHCFIFGGIGCFCSLMALICNLKSVLIMYFAPKAYLLEQLFKVI